MIEAVALVGPTAAGKSALALSAAQGAGAVEIVSVDSMAVYRRMDIGTATPSAADRAAVPHHLVDRLEPWDDCTLTVFQAAATAAMADIVSRGRVPLLVGGTGLYHRAVIDQLTIPGQFPEERAVLEAEAATPEGVTRLFARLCELDPIAAARIEPGNVRRIVRALEVWEGSGAPFSSFGPGLDTYGSTTVEQVGYLPELSDLRTAAELRITGWIDKGLLLEVAALHDDPRGLSRTAAQAIGYREFLSHLDGTLSLDAAIEETARRTWNLIRRQIAWFRRDPRVRWTTTPQETLSLLAELLAQVHSSAQVRD